MLRAALFAFLLVLTSCASPEVALPTTKSFRAVAGLRLPEALIRQHRARAGRPIGVNRPGDPGIVAPPVGLGAGGCADVTAWPVLATIPASSVDIFDAMTGAICDPRCAAVCAGPGAPTDAAHPVPWCDAIAAMTIVDSTDTCNNCAILTDPAGALSEILDCANDPNNTAP